MLTLTDKDMTLLKSMTKPPAAVRIVLEATCIMCSVSADRIPDPNDMSRRIMSFTGPATKLINRPKFLQFLVNFDIETVPKKNLNKIRNNYILK